MTTKCGKQVHTSRGGDLNETNQAGSGDVIRSRSRDKIKALYLHYHSAYGHETAMMVTNLERLLPIMLLYLLVTWSCEITGRTKNISNTTMPTTIKLGRGMTYHERFTHNAAWPLNTCLTGSRDKLKPLFRHYRNAFGHKTWQGDDLTWTSNNHIITWSYEIIWQTKIAYPLPQCLRLPNLAQWGYIQWGASFRKLIQSFDNAVLQGRVKY